MKIHEKLVFFPCQFISVSLKRTSNGTLTDFFSSGNLDLVLIIPGEIQISLYCYYYPSQFIGMGDYHSSQLDSCRRLWYHPDSSRCQRVCSGSSCSVSWTKEISICSISGSKNQVAGQFRQNSWLNGKNK